MSELAEWLRAQILERKKIAEAAATSPRPDWNAITRRGKKKMVGIIEATTNMQPSRRWLFNSETEATNVLHIALNDPQDTIARCEAELAILDEHQTYPATYPGAYDFGCSRCSPHGGDGIVDPPGWCPTVKHLASGYRFRPGYEEAWSRE